MAGQMGEPVQITVHGDPEKHPLQLLPSMLASMLTSFGWPEMVAMMVGRYTATMVEALVSEHPEWLAEAVAQVRTAAPQDWQDGARAVAAAFIASEQTPS